MINNRAHIDARSTTNVALPPVETVWRQLTESFNGVTPQLPARKCPQTKRQKANCE
jgi:hypothetical protein